MADNYESQFQLLHSDVNAFSPMAANKLLQIHDVLGARAAFYAAFVIVCLEARGKQSNYRIVTTLTAGDLNNFTYFEYTQGKPEAVTEFNEVLAYYQADCQRRIGHDQGSSAPV